MSTSGSCYFLVHLGMFGKIRKAFIPRITLIFFLVLTPLLLSGQDHQEEVDLQKTRRAGLLNYHTSLGLSTSFIPGIGAYTGIFAAPQLDYTASKRLTLHGGLIASEHIPLYTALREDNSSLASFTNLSMFVAASYRISEEFTVYGAGTRSLLSDTNHYLNDFDSMDRLSFGAAYKFGNFTIGASFSTGYSNIRGTGYAPGGPSYMGPAPFIW